MARLSNRRTGAEEYRGGYSRSPAWFARRDQWFADVQAMGYAPACQVCMRTRDDLSAAHKRTKLASLDLHHVSYARVTRGHRNRWVAGEHHEDLVAMCRGCHEQLHTRLDDGKTYYGWSRETATFRIIADMRAELEQAPHLLARWEADYRRKDTQEQERRKARKQRQENTHV